MISDNDKKMMSKYRHIIAALIDESIGYFTPLAALRAIQAHKQKETFDCEWYWHCASLFFQNNNKFHVSDKEFKNKMLDVNHDHIKFAFKYRHHKNLKHCLDIVDRNLNSYESLFASWF